MFVNDCCIMEEGSKITAKDIYTSYANYCKNIGEGNDSQKTFGSRLGSLHPQLSKSKNGGGNIVWNGVGLKPTTAKAT